MQITKSAYQMSKREDHDSSNSSATLTAASALKDIYTKMEEVLKKTQKYTDPLNLPQKTIVSTDASTGPIKKPCAICKMDVQPNDCLYIFPCCTVPAHITCISRIAIGKRVFCPQCKEKFSDEDSEKILSLASILQS